MAVDPRLALMGADPSGPANAFMISRDNARAGVFNEQKMAADAAKSAAEARSAKLGQLANFAFRVAREPIQTRGPLLEQAKMAAMQLYGNDPQVTQILSQVTPENVEGYASALVSIKDQLDAGKTDAEIDQIHNNMRNDNIKTQSGVRVDNAQIGNYGASTANYRDQIRSRQGQDQATVYGQLPEGQIYDPQTGRAGLIPGVMIKPGEAGSAPGSMPINFDNETKLRGEYNKQTDDFAAIGSAYEKILGAAQAPSAANDMSMIFSFMKMLDPTSVVREGEFANAQNAAGVPDRIVNLYNNILNGERLNDQQRQDFLNSARTVYDAANRQFAAVGDQYKALAGSYGMDPNRIVTDRRAPSMRNEGQRQPVQLNPADPQSDWERLPPGTPFIGPDGETRVKQ